MFTQCPRLLFTVVACLLLTFMPSGAAFGQFDEEDNAAYWYDRVLKLNAEVSAQDSLLISLIDWGRPTTGAERAALSRVRPLLEALRRGSQQEYLDWNLDYSEGPGLLLPHLGALRHAAKIARADAILNVQDGNSAVAINRLTTLIRLSGQMADGRTFISSLVGIALFRLADNEIQMFFDRGIVTPSQSTPLLRATAWLDPHDPFGIIDSISGEQIFFGEWLERTNQEEGGRQKIIDAIVGSDGDATLRIALHKLSEAEFADGMHGYYETMDHYIEAFNHDDPEVARKILAEIEADIVSGECGPLVEFLLPAFGRIYETMLDSRTELAARNELLKGIAIGEVDPAQLMNAAVWYLQGIENLKQLEQPWLDALASLAAGGVPDATTLLALDETFESARPALDQFSAGSKKRRCDFSHLQRRDPAFIPRYLVGMQRGLRLLELDTLRRLAHQSTAEIERGKAIVELSTIFRITAHLSDDETLLSALIAHRAFDWSAAILESEILGKRGASVRSEPEDPAATGSTSLALTAKQYRLLRGSILWISQSDPFGYLRSPVRTREKLVLTLQRLTRGATEGKTAYPHETAQAFLTKCPGSTLFMILAILDTTDTKGKPREGGPISRVEVENFEAFQLPALLTAALDHSTALMEYLQEEERADHPLFLNDVEDYTAYESRRQSARKDLRRLVRYLEGFDPTPEPTEEPEADQDEDSGVPA